MDPQSILWSVFWVWSLFWYLRLWVDPGECWGPDTRGTVTSDTRLLITGGDGNTAVIKTIARTGGMLLSPCAQSLIRPPRHRKASLSIKPETGLGSAEIRWCSWLCSSSETVTEFGSHLFLVIFIFYFSYKINNIADTSLCWNFKNFFFHFTRPFILTHLRKW